MSNGNTKVVNSENGTNGMIISPPASGLTRSPTTASGTTTVLNVMSMWIVHNEAAMVMTRAIGTDTVRPKDSNTNLTSLSTRENRSG